MPAAPPTDEPAPAPAGERAGVGEAGGVAGGVAGGHAPAAGPAGGDGGEGPRGEAEGPPEPEHPSLFERILVRKLRRGDPRAFRELVLRHQDRVYSMCLRMLGDADEAEDVSQEVFVSVHAHLTQFRGECRLSTWIYRVTRNHCLNRIKYLSRREAAGSEALEGEEASEVLLSSPPRPDRALLGAEERQKVQQALQRLEPASRLLVVLRDIEGMSYEEIARVAELPQGTVKSRLHRARAALARMLAGAGMAPEGARAEPGAVARAAAGGRP